MTSYSPDSLINYDIHPSDITFIVEGEKFHVHKVMMRTEEYFRALIDDEFPDESEISLNGPSKPFKTIIKYICEYNFAIDEMNISEAIEVLKMCDMFRIQHLALAIVSHLKLKLSLQNACAILEVSRLLCVYSLTKICINFMDRCAANVLRHEEFMTLSQVS